MFARGPQSTQVDSGGRVHPKRTVAVRLFAGAVVLASCTTGDDDGALPITPGGVPAEVPLYSIVTLDFAGPYAHESEGVNPFRDYRMVVRFEAPSGRLYDVPGFFDGDGQGGPQGRLWRARFLPDEPGNWRYEVDFRSGNDIAISLNPTVGVELAPDGENGVLRVGPMTHANAEGFYKRGRLEYVGAHHLRFSDGTWWLKAGSGSPENFLGFAGFDDTIDLNGGLATPELTNGVHHYEAHVDESQTNAPYFVGNQGVDSAGITGAIQYLASQRVSSIYVLLNNVQGDGREVYPWVTWWDPERFDLSKLRQWYAVLDFAQRRGIMLHLLFFEAENWHSVDDPQRALYLREMIARFGAFPAVKWNLQEEANASLDDLMTTAQFVRAVDPYDKPLCFHTGKIVSGVEYDDYEAILGSELFDATSFQCEAGLAGALVEHWRTASAEAGRPWVVDVDEIAPGVGDENAAENRRADLWDTLLSGGGIEIYCGYFPGPLGGDLTMEDFSTREETWTYLRVAREFLRQNVNFQAMEPADELVSGEAGAFGGAEAMREPGVSIVVYLPSTTNEARVDLSDESGVWTKRWFDPRTGELHPAEVVLAGTDVGVGVPPSGAGEDWALLFEKDGGGESEGTVPRQKTSDSSRRLQLM